MNQREQFGNYILFRKLAEDPLGETFRAGRIGKQAVERVVLLRVFNGQGIDAQRLWGRLRTRGGVQQVLRSPNLAEGIDAGEVRGVPYVGYDYVSGKTIANLLEQAEKKRRPVPLDHALLIVERMAQGLAVAYETRFGDERVVHGFVVPHFVLLSGEGETRVMGIEAGPGLREAASGPAVHQAFARYLSPEALAGEPVNKTDDVYSLGVLLYELLTNRRLPPPAATGYGPVVDDAMVAGEGSPLQPEIATLLKKALAHREQRWPDIGSFHKALAKVMSDGAYNPTTFNLAFFMHSLFREDIERETQEIEAEKKIQVPIQAPAPQVAGAHATPATVRPPAAAAPAGPVQGGRAPIESTSAGVSPSGGGNKGLLYGGIAAAVLLLAGGAYFLMGRTPAAPPSKSPPRRRRLSSRLRCSRRARHRKSCRSRWPSFWTSASSPARTRSRSSTTNRSRLFSGSSKSRVAGPRRRQLRLRLPPLRLRRPQTTAQNPATTPHHAACLGRFEFDRSDDDRRGADDGRPRDDGRRTAGYVPRHRPHLRR